MKALMVILMFLIICSLFIISNNNLAMHKQENVKKFFGLYAEWTNQIYVNAQILTGEIVRLDWLP